MTRLNDRIDLMEEASQSSHTHITNRLSSLSQKQDSHHTGVFVQHRAGHMGHI